VPPWVWIAAVGGAGLALRLLLAPYPGFFGDLQDFTDWGNILNAHLLTVYSEAGRASALHPVGPPPAFPPPSLWLFGLSVRLYRLLSGAALARPLLPGAPLLAGLMKLPSLLGDALTAGILWRLGRAASGPVWGAAAAGLWWLSPVALLDGALWGQVDVLPAPLLILALLLAARRRWGWSGAALGLALLWKPQAAVYLPLMAAVAVTRAGVEGALRAAGAAALVLAAGWLPYAGQLGAYLSDFHQTFVDVPFTSANAYNLWWLLGVGLRPADGHLLGGVSYSLAGWAVFAVAGLLATWFAIRARDESELLLAGGVLGLAFFVLAPLQHERYLLPALPLLLAAGVRRREWLGWYGLASVLAGVNMGLVALASVPGGGPLPHLDPGVVLPNALALAAVLLLLELLRRELRPAPVAAGRRGGGGRFLPALPTRGSGR
jgi:hypothetical protein